MKDENKIIARLIKQIQRGNQAAFEEFYKLTSPKAYFLALKITQNEHDAEDILQESYIKVLEKINEIDTSQNINSWFIKIVSNKSKDLLKSRNHLVFDGEDEGCFDDIQEEKAEFCPEENLNQEEMRLEVMAAIDELTTEKRACIMMMYFGDMSVKEIAESIEVPESTVKNRLYTARKDLKTRFEKNGNILYGAALGGVLFWALNKTSVTASATFLASAASAEIVAGATAAYTAGATATVATATTATAATSSATAAASAGTGIAAKIAVISVAQKIAVGVATTAIIGGSTAGVVTVVKNATPEEPTTQMTEEFTTAPVLSTKYVFNEMTLPEIITETVSSTEKETRREFTGTKRTSTTKYRTIPASTTKAVTKKETTTKAKTTTAAQSTTTLKETTTQITTTTTQPTTVTTTEEETTTRPTTTRPSTTVTTTQPTTTVPTTTEPTTQAQATLIIKVTDFDNNPVITITEKVDAGTELTREYLVSLVKDKGYEAMAGVYGEAIGTVAEGGVTYNFTAEL